MVNDFLKDTFEKFNNNFVHFLKKNEMKFTLKSLTKNYTLPPPPCLLEKGTRVAGAGVGAEKFTNHFMAPREKEV